jgi:hypothetical protein
VIPGPQCQPNRTSRATTLGRTDVLSCEFPEPCVATDADPPSWTWPAADETEVKVAGVSDFGI